LDLDCWNNYLQLVCIYVCVYMYVYIYIYIYIEIGNINPFVFQCTSKIALWKFCVVNIEHYIKWYTILNVYYVLDTM
jgi:hypothetical protein